MLEGRFIRGFDEEKIWDDFSPLWGACGKYVFSCSALFVCPTGSPMFKYCYYFPYPIAPSDDYLSSLFLLLLKNLCRFSCILCSFQSSEVMFEAQSWIWAGNWQNYFNYKWMIQYDKFNLTSIILVLQFCTILSFDVYINVTELTFQKLLFVIVNYTIPPSP